MIKVELFFDVPFDDPRTREAIASLFEWQFDPTADGATKVLVPWTTLPAGLARYSSVVQFVMNLLTWRTSLPAPTEIHISGGTSS